VTKQQINPDSPLAESIYSLFRTMGDSQREWQDTIGFGEEGHRLRADAAPDSEGWVDMEAEVHLRNYYIAKLMLIVTEVAEAVEEARTGHKVTETYHPSHQPGCPISDLRIWPHENLHESDYTCTCSAKPEGIPSELADVVIRIWSLCGEAEIDLGPIIVEKLNYNATRAQRHGGKVI
jgi:NTP pyrophosphatase (non-canonical NTP hydrolase)